MLQESLLVAVGWQVAPAAAALAASPAPEVRVGGRDAWQGGAGQSGVGLTTCTAARSHAAPTKQQM